MTLGVLEGCWKVEGVEITWFGGGAELTVVRSTLVAGLIGTPLSPLAGAEGGDEIVWRNWPGC